MLLIIKITVAVNDRVYINPGTTVLFSGSTSGFDVNGKFLAVGTPYRSNHLFFVKSRFNRCSYNGFIFLILPLIRLA
ncbi:MAG: hypothetical protein IPJ23_00935 [Ignavibacteriales bacterium]|nr:hypothetical protein [Ignavibacteriales bacterium]